MSGTKVSIDETCKVVALSDDGETAEVFLGTENDTKLKEGICSGILKTRGTTDDGMGISREASMIDSGRQVES